MDHLQKNISFFMSQQYHVTHQICLDTKSIFVDAFFRPNDQSIFHRRHKLAVQWKSVKGICTEPHFAIEDPSYLDVFRSSYGSSSFVAAVSFLASHLDIWNKVVPEAFTQEKMLSSGGSKRYSGVFRFRFWRFGTWYEVIVDDKLPTVEGQLCGIRSVHFNVFWCALLEKAYAKLVGCYETIGSMNAGCIIQDMTGCLLQDLPVAPAAATVEARERLYNELRDSLRYGRVVLTCTIKPDKDNPEGNETRHGLKVGHYFIVRSMKSVQIRPGQLRLYRTKNVELIKLRDPTATEEWMGLFSYRTTSDLDQITMGLKSSAEGEFWMSFGDFCSNFTDISFCRMVPLERVISAPQWQETLLYGQWMLQMNPDENTAGGSLEISKDTFIQNPQYTFDIYDEAIGYVIVQLQQKEARNHPATKPQSHHKIGIHLLRIENNRPSKLHRFFYEDLEMITPHFANRTSLLQTRLPKGRYVIVPTTHKPEIDAEYLLRTYSQSVIGLRKLDRNYPVVSCLAFCIGYPQLVTRVRVCRGKNCTKPDGTSVGNVYVQISCECSLVRSRLFEKSRSPEFDTRAIFYRKRPDKNPITFTVYHDGVLCDTFVGHASIDAKDANTGTSVEIPLCGRGNQSGKRYPGTLFIDVISSIDINAL